MEKLEQMSIYFPKGLLEKIRNLAEEEERTFSKQVVYLIKYALARMEECD